MSCSLELTGGGLSSYNLLHTASSPCKAITLLFPHRAEERRAAHQVRPASCLFRVGGGGGGTERRFGGPVEQLRGASRPPVPPGPGSWTLRVRAPTPQPLPARAPLSGSLGPASAAARSLSPAGCTRAARQSFGLALRPPGAGRRPRRARTSCAWRSRGRSPGAQSAAAKAVHPGAWNRRRRLPRG